LTSPALRAPSPKERGICSESMRKWTQHLMFRDAIVDFHSAKSLSLGEGFRERSK